MKKPYTPNSQDALLITDIQLDFLPGGALPVEGGNEIIPVINEYINHFLASKAHIVASRDWHPQDHISFNTMGGPWPSHCIKDTAGAQFSPNLKLPASTTIISKATEPNHEAYSAFDHTNLEETLKNISVLRLFVSGLATDYCVVNTVLDALKLGFEVVVLIDATRGINVKAGDVDRAVEAMVEGGAVLASDADLAEPPDVLPLETATSDALADKPEMLFDAKRKARMRSRGSNGQLKSER